MKPMVLKTGAPYEISIAALLNQLRKGLVPKTKSKDKHDKNLPCSIHLQLPYSMDG